LKAASSGHPPTPPIVKAVIPVAGMATRLLPLTKVVPKALLPLGRKPVIQQIVEELAAAGIEQVGLVVGPRTAAVAAHFAPDPALAAHLRRRGLDPAVLETDAGLTIVPIRQPEPLGLGHAIAQARAFVGDAPFVVALGDAVIREPRPGALVRRLIACYRATRPAFVIAVQQVPDEQVRRSGIVEADAEGWVRRILEKPSPEATPVRRASAGRYVFGPVLFRALDAVPPDAQGEIGLTEAMNRLLERGERGLAIPLGPDQRRDDVGELEAYLAAFAAWAADRGLRTVDCGLQTVDCQDEV